MEISPLKKRKLEKERDCLEGHTFKLDVQVRFEQRPEEVKENPKELMR